MNAYRPTAGTEVATCTADADECARIAEKIRLDVVADFFARGNWSDHQAFRRVAEVRYQFGFFACAETRAIVGLPESAPQFADEFGRTACERANLRTGLAVADRTGPVGDLNRNKIRGILALRAVAWFAIHRGAGTVEDHFEAKISVIDAALRAREAREDALALAPQVLDRFEQVAAPNQESRI